MSKSSEAVAARDGTVDTEIPELLVRISRVLDRPVAYFHDAALAKRMRQDADVLHLWQAIRSDGGRHRALDALRAVARDEEAA